MSSERRNHVRYNNPPAHQRRISDKQQVTFLPCDFLELSKPSSLSWTCHLLSNMMECPTLFWQRYLAFPGVVGNAASLAASRGRRVHYTVPATCLIKLPAKLLYVTKLVTPTLSVNLKITAHRKQIKWRRLVDMCLGDRSVILLSTSWLIQ